jgi:hypothetical protein
MDPILVVERTLYPWLSSRLRTMLVRWECLPPWPIRRVKTPGELLVRAVPEHQTPSSLAVTPTASSAPFPLLPPVAGLIDYLCQRKEWGQCREEPFSDDHHRGLFGVNPIGPGKQAITDFHFDIPRPRDEESIRLDEVFMGDSDPHLIEHPTNRVDAGLESVTEPFR